MRLKLQVPPRRLWTLLESKYRVGLLLLAATTRTRVRSILIRLGTWAEKQSRSTADRVLKVTTIICSLLITAALLYIGFANPERNWLSDRVITQIVGVVGVLWFAIVSACWLILHEPDEDCRVEVRQVSEYQPTTHKGS